MFLRKGKNNVIQSLEELNINVPFTELIIKKNFGQRYRVPLSSVESFRKYYKKKKVFSYTFIYSIYISTLRLIDRKPSTTLGLQVIEGFLYLK